MQTNGHAATLSPAIPWIPRPYLRDRAGRLIFIVWVGTFFAHKFLSRQAGCIAEPGLLDHRPARSRPCWIMTMLDEDEVENTPDLSISPEKVCYLVCYLEGRGYWRTDF
jgi:hypothetical protein